MGKKIPEFKSDEEAAEFWDTHDFAEYMEDAEIVTDIKFVPSAEFRRMAARRRQEHARTGRVAKHKVDDAA